MSAKHAFNNWGFKNSECPLIIAGPCSAESEQQVMDTAKQLQNKQISLFRAGIWKPRTRPNSFQGVGAIGLKWLQKVQNELGIDVITEVANANHIEEVLNHNINNIWIGARTTTNPFAIQEIADAIKGCDVRVFIKNPINPDFELWLGAIERIKNAGIKNIAAIHRGFSTFNKALYRNNPQWQIPIELQQQMPDVPIICDPSHIGGQTKTLYEISQKALDLNFDGLIIETHVTPQKALSDSQQQITPEQLQKLLETLVIRERDVENNEVLSVIEDLREKIDVLDNELINTIEQRFKLVEEIGKQKKLNNISILQSDRWRQLLKQTIKQGEEKQMSRDFIVTMFKAIHQESINKQTKILHP